MAYDIKEASSKPSVTTNTTLYQVTAAKDFIVTSLRITNMHDTTEQTVKIGFSATATPGSAEWVFRAKIKPYSPVCLSGDLISGGKYIVVYNETAGDVIFSLSGYEEI